MTGSSMRFLPMAALVLMTVAMVLGACGSKQEHPTEVETTIADSRREIAGDSTLYGLACDGCTDSVLVFLPYMSDRLDTLDIIDAWQQKRIFGKPHIGDELAITLNPEDSCEALCVINLEVLRGSWCYMVTPELRNVENMPRRMQRRMMAEMQNLPDSLRQLWLTPREYTLRLKSDYTAQVHGGMMAQTTTDDMSPVEFPMPRRYTEWHIYNGRLVLKADTISGFAHEGEQPVSDTAAIKELREDTLILAFPDREQGYYNKEGSRR